MKYQDVVEAWNDQADEFNQWCDLDEEEKSKIKCSSNFNAKFSVDIDIDTKKIFEIPELESRIPALKLSRYFKPSFENSNETEDELLFVLK